MGAQLYGDEHGLHDELVAVLPHGWGLQKEERMAKNNEPVTLTKTTTVTVDGEKVELAAGTELSRELAKKLGVVKKGA